MDGTPICNLEDRGDFFRNVRSSGLVPRSRPATADRSKHETPLWAIERGPCRRPALEGIQGLEHRRPPLGATTRNDGSGSDWVGAPSINAGSRDSGDSYRLAIDRDRATHGPHPSRLQAPPAGKIGDHVRGRNRAHNRLEMTAAVYEQCHAQPEGKAMSDDDRTSPLFPL
jgi:hypothetical protein